MKHFFTLMALVAGLNSVVTAQISITASDMPTVGDAYTYVTGDSIWGAGIDVSTGVNKTWDFSNAVPSTSFDPTIEQWIVVSASPFGSEYASATIAAISDSGDSTDAQFFTIDGTGLYQIGLGSVDGNSFFTPGLELVKLPMTFNTTFSSASDIETSLEGLPVTGTATNEAVVDGWGTLKTHWGLFRWCG